MSFVGAGEDLYEDPLVSAEDRMVKVTPNLLPDEPEPPPIHHVPSSSRKKKQESAGDRVLLLSMYPNRPDLAKDGGETVLDTSPSPPRKRHLEPNTERRDGEMEVDESLDARLAREMAEKEEADREAERKERVNTVVYKSLFGMNANTRTYTDSPEPKPKEKDSIPDIPLLPTPIEVKPTLPPVKPKPAPIDTFRRPDPVDQQQPQTARHPPHERNPHYRKNSIPPNFQFTSREASSPADSSAHTPIQPETAILASPVSQHLRSPPTPRHQLPRIQDAFSMASPQSASSPQTLPGISPLLGVADQRRAEIEVITRARGSSLSQTPNFSAQSPSFPFSSHASPTDSATSPYNPLPNFDFRRRSTAADTTFSRVLPPAISTTDSHHTSPNDSTFSPADTLNGTAITTPSEHSARIGTYQNGPPTPHTTVSSATSPQGPPPNYPEQPIAPLPNGHTTKLPLPANAVFPAPAATAPNGHYQCHHPGCSAAPFQTQYLLNSHATVHSSNRPHYCMVPGCPRGPGGQGFKRKNEMKRHGLVHDSPGYICPFCPEREHRYPRPDNLQRHVRVHHANVPNNDARLREVLERKDMLRPSGGGGSHKKQKGRSMSLSAPTGLGLHPSAGLGVGG